jgi:hypothetical protein
MIQITERDDRLYLEFWEPKWFPDGSVSVESEVVKSIDISAHIERAVEKVIADAANAMSDKIEAIFDSQSRD